MTQAENYMLLLERLGRVCNDTSYRVALFILSSDAKLTKIALPHISGEGIEFSSMLKHKSLYERDIKLLQIAHSLFHFNTNGYPSPYEISQLGLPYLDIVTQAIYLASGLHRLNLCEDADGRQMLEIVTGRYDEAKRMQTGLTRFMQAAMIGDG